MIIRKKKCIFHTLQTPILSAGRILANDVPPRGITVVLKIIRRTISKEKNNLNESEKRGKLNGGEYHLYVYIFSVSHYACKSLGTKWNGTKSTSRLPGCRRDVNFRSHGNIALTYVVGRDGETHPFCSNACTKFHYLRVKWPLAIRLSIRQNIAFTLVPRVRRSTAVFAINCTVFDNFTERA